MFNLICLTLRCQTNGSQKLSQISSYWGEKDIVSQGFVSDIVIKAFWSVGNFLAMINAKGWVGHSPLNYSCQKLF